MFVLKDKSGAILAPYGQALYIGDALKYAYMFHKDKDVVVEECRYVGGELEATGAVIVEIPAGMVVDAIFFHPHTDDESAGIASQYIYGIEKRCGVCSAADVAKFSQTHMVQYITKAYRGKENFTMYMRVISNDDARATCQAL